jgi:hypothetical protein
LDCGCEDKPLGRSTASCLCCGKACQSPLKRNLIASPTGRMRTGAYVGLNARARAWRAFPLILSQLGRRTEPQDFVHPVCRFCSELATRCGSGTLW